MPAKPARPSFNSSTSLFDTSAIQYFVRCYSKYWRNLVFYALIVSMQSLLVLPTLFFVRESFDTAIPEGNIELLVLYASGIVVIRLLTSVLVIVMRVLIVRDIKAAVTEMRQDLMAKLYGLSKRFHGKASIDDVHTQVVMDSERFDVMSNTVFSGFTPAAITSVVLFGVLMILHWQLSLIALTVFPLVYYSNLLSGKYVKRSVFQFQRAFESFSKGVMFVLHQMDLTRIQGHEDKEIAQQSQHLQKLRNTGEKMALSYSLHGQIQKNVVGLSGLLILVVGGISIANGTMTIGEFIAYYMAAGMLNGQVSSMISNLPDIITGNESLVTLSKLVESDDLEPYSGTTKIDSKGNIDLIDVDFSYDQKEVLRGVNFSIRPDSNIVIVGANGAGKSTIVSLILGFWKPTSGQVLSEHIPLDEIDIRNHRRSIGVVMQHPALFAGSIYENITYGIEEASEDEVVAAAKKAMAHEFIEALPNGYQTSIGDYGNLLSGGEKQKIAIARVLLAKPRFVIFDEPTNHLDDSSIREILNSIYKSTDRPAILTITHDRTVIKFSDEVYQLSDGKLFPLSVSQESFQPIAQLATQDG